MSILGLKSVLTCKRGRKDTSLYVKVYRTKYLQWTEGTFVGFFHMHGESNACDIRMQSWLILCLCGDNRTTHSVHEIKKSDIYCWNNKQNVHKLQFSFFILCNRVRVIDLHDHSITMYSYNIEGGDLTIWVLGHVVQKTMKSLPDAHVTLKY